MEISLERINGLSECVEQAIQGYLVGNNIEWSSISDLHRPVLRFEAFIEEKEPVGSACRRSARIASRTLDLDDLVTPPPSNGPAANTDDSFGYPNTHQDTTGEHARRIRTSTVDGRADENAACETEPETDDLRRNGVGGLRISQAQGIQEDASEHQRRIQSDNRTFPKRRKAESDGFVFQPSTLDKLIIGIWEQIHGTLKLDPSAIFDQLQIVPTSGSELVTRAQDVLTTESTSGSLGRTDSSFSRMNSFCRKVTQASRVCRSLEIIVQARWVELFEEQVRLRILSSPGLSATKQRKVAFMEACQDFGWPEKELRNKMAVWRGYKEVKDAAGWAALVFAGMGIYRFCKYRVSFEKGAMRRLQNLQTRLEVAADTLHPNWRQLLSVVGEQSTPKYAGHPHDWVVFEDGSEPLPLRSTYLQYDPCFEFEHIDESIIDEGAWGCDDPRWIPQPTAMIGKGNDFVCAVCGEQQSDDADANACYCFPNLFGCIKRNPPPIQVFRTADGRNNGLMALTPFERGAAVGEFVGSVTKGLRHLDVMDSVTGTSSYQIWQGRQGNYTRFINHSCKANAQFQQFIWLDTQRVVLVSKGIAGGTEITVDYSDRYWGGLDKACLCGEPCCRYRRGR